MRIGSTSILLAATVWLAGAPPALAQAKSPAKKAAAPKKKKKPSKKTPTPKKPPPYPCGALPWEPVLLTSRISREGDTATVTQDLLVHGRAPLEPPPKTGGKLDPGRLYVAFGAPGLPLSMRIEFAGLRDGELGFPGHVADRTRALVYAQSPESDGACTVLGRDREAGVVVQVPPDLAVDPGTGLAVLRIEQTLQVGKLPSGARDLVLRLASFAGKPVRLGPVHAKEPSTLALCAHGQPDVPVRGSPLFQDVAPQQNLCVTLSAAPERRR